MDFSGVLAGLSIVLAVAAIVAAGALMAMPDFARWCTDKIASFFSDSEQGDVDDETADEESGEVCEDVCADKGHEYFGEPECAYCGAPDPYREDE